MDFKEDRWYTLAEIAEYLAVGRDTLMVWIKQYGMPATRIGKLWRFKRSDVDEWMRNNNNVNEEE